MKMKTEYEKPETEILSIYGETDLMGLPPGGGINPGQESYPSIPAKEHSDDDIAWDDNIDIWNNANNN